MTTINGLTGIDKIVPQSLKILDAINSDEAVSKNQLDTKPTGFKNLIINGGFDVWQRGTSFTGSAQYTADRWRSNAPETQVQTDIDFPNGSYGYSCNMYNPVGIPAILQGVELVNNKSGVFEVGRTFTFSCYVKSTMVDSLTFRARFVDLVSSATNSVEVENTVINDSVTTSWTKISHTFTINVAPNSTNTSLEVLLYSTNGVGITFKMAQVQLEEGSVATPFEHRPYGLELSLCQRYYETSFVSGGGYSNAFSTDASIIFTQVAEFRVKKRVIPTISFTTSSASMSFMTYTTSKSGIYGYYASASSRQYTWAADAEL